MSHSVHDIDPLETREWLEALDAVLEHDGSDRARFLLDTLRRGLEQRGVPFTVPRHTPYVNSIPPEAEPSFPGDLEVEARIESLVRWNAAAIVTRANRKLSSIGGHIATFQSVSTLWEVGFNHFWRAPSGDHAGDLVYFQGHASPGIYARAFLEGRLQEDDLERFRQEASGAGLSSYPHSWLQPDFWQFATVSMGLGPLMAIYQARFMRYLQQRGKADTTQRHVWAFLGDGETDEPESTGVLRVAAQDQLDNLIFVVNCNLQRLDGPVRGNGKIVDELEAIFLGAGWNVIKLLWGSEWDPIFARDPSGRLAARLGAMVDGELQALAAGDGASMREKIFGADPELAALVADLTDDQIYALRRGGHDPKKVYAAYAAAVAHQGAPTVILAQTVKGYGMGEAGEALYTSHQQKKLDGDALVQFGDRLGVSLSEADLHELPYLRPEEDSAEGRYLRARRAALGGSLPQRRVTSQSLPAPPLETYGTLTKGSGEREQSTTMAFVRALAILLRDKELGPRVVPIVADEARTFGMEGLFRQIGIYAPNGQRYQPVDAGQLQFYKESADGQVLQEGINEAGATGSWIAAGTSYANHGTPMIPFYIFYSMFGFQRVADLIWAAADMRTRGFLLGATSGRTTLNGEGLQHEDGHSHLMAATVPNCVSYDPTYAYELAVIMQDGLRRMVQEEEDVFYYLTLLNENYPQPPMPAGVEEGIRRGMYRLRTSKKRGAKRVQLLGCGAILREVEAAADMLEADHDVAADVWSVTSFTELRRNGLKTDRHRMLHPEEAGQRAFLATCLADHGGGPVVAATDYMRAYADQVRAWVPGRYITLGTDGFGRSDTREALRDFFEVDRRWITIAALEGLAAEGQIAADSVTAAISAYGIDPAKPDPTTV